MEQGEFLFLDDTLHRGGTSLDSSLLVSIIVVASHDAGLDQATLSGVASVLRDRYAFFEILLIGSDRSGLAMRNLLGQLARVTPQIRCLEIESGAGFDLMAAHGFRECIGDIVVLTSSDELPYVDFDLVLDKLRDDKSLVRLRRGSKGLFERFAAFLVRSVTGLHVDVRFHRTLGLTRQLLSELMADPEEIALLRFTARRLFGHQTVLRVNMPARRGGARLMLMRIDLLARLIATSAPRLLRLVSATCFMLSLLSSLALAYVIGVWLFKREVAEGWTTITTLIALWMFVQFNATAVLSLGLSRVLDRQERTRIPRLVNETTVSDLFKDVGILNVETVRMRSHDVA